MTRDEAHTQMLEAGHAINAAAALMRRHLDLMHRFLAEDASMNSVGHILDPTLYNHGRFIARFSSQQQAIEEAVACYRYATQNPARGHADELDFSPRQIGRLRSQNLACWCALDAPCHADALLELANAPLRCTPA